MTTTFDFDLPDDIDANLAAEGVWVNGTNRAGKLLGRFLVAAMDDANPRWKAWKARIARMHNRDQTPEQQEANGRRMLIETLLLDWELKDKKGKVIPFDKATAHAYFSNPNSAAALAQIAKVAGDPMSYLPLDEDELPEGN